jgi:CheY-like chemotaxis protein
MTAHHILIIEDDPNTAMLLQRGLDRLGYTSVSYAMASEGMDFALHHQPRFILMDLLLPQLNLNGIIAIQHLKSHPETYHIPIVAVTAGDVHLIDQAMQAGADAYLRKPFTMLDLEQVVLKFFGHNVT